LAFAAKNYKYKHMKIEVSNGEIADKLSIIEIKLKHIQEVEKRKNLQNEYEVLDAAVKNIIDKKHEYYQELLKINQELWDIEDTIRDLEREQQFGEKFVETARAVYFTNDKRSEVKRKINELTGSNLIEEKSYQKYD
jgi:predicted nuclease with TOPRIM domain